MPIVVRIIGLLIAAMGVLFAVKPQMIQQVFDFFCKDKRLYIAGVIRILLGVILLVAATECTVTWIILVLGIIFLIAGILVFALGIEKCKLTVSRILQKPLKIIRLITIIPIVIGILILIAA